LLGINPPFKFRFQLAAVDGLVLSAIKGRSHFQPIQKHPTPRAIQVSPSVSFCGCGESLSSAVNNFIGHQQVFPKVGNSPQVFPDKILQ
jgi:hypothetical protein